MKLLYVAGLHPLQNADDCLMWDKLGIDWVDTGYYSLSEKPGDLPFIKRKCPELYEELSSQTMRLSEGDFPGTNCGRKNVAWTGFHGNNLFKFSKSFIDKFDLIFFNHFPENIEKNLEALAGKPVIIKTFGMHGQPLEERIQWLRHKYGILVVRNNSCESNCDAIIRGSVVKDEEEISGWTGRWKEVCTFSNFFNLEKERAKHYEAVIAHFKNTKFHLYGIENNRYNIKASFVTHERKIEVLRNCRVNLVVGTPNASNTYSFVEGWILGSPVVAFGPTLWQTANYEIASLVTNGVDGFYSDNYAEIAKIIESLIVDEKLAQRIGEAGRKKAIEVYGRENLARQWREFFNKIGVM